MKLWKLFINDFFSWKWLFFIIIIFLYEGRLILDFIDLADSYHININQWDILTHSLNNHLFIFYFIIPFFLLYSWYFIIQEANMYVLIRTKNYLNWISHIMLRTSFVISWFYIFWIVIILLLSHRIAFEATWSSYALEDPFLGNHSFYLYNSGLHPLIALLVQLLLLYTFLIVIVTSLAVTYILFPRPQLLTIQVILYFLLTLVSFRWISDATYWMKIDSYAISSAAVYVWPTLFVPLGILVGMIGSFYVFVLLRYQFNSLPFISLIKAKKAESIYLLICILAIVFYHSSSEITLFTVWDYFYVQFLGVSTDGYSFKSYLFTNFLYVGIIYLYQVKLYETTNNYMYYELIRYPSFWTWFAKHFIKSTRLIIFLLLGWASLTLVVAYLQGLSLDHRMHSVISYSLFQLLYQYFIIGILQLLNYILLAFIIQWVWNNIFYNFLVLLAILILGTINSAQLLPVALNSLGFITDDTNPFLTTAKLLFFMILQFGIVIFLFLKKKDHGSR